MSYNTVIDILKLVSVLFSEPKIPHRDHIDISLQRGQFQCSSASRKFLIDRRRREHPTRRAFQCSSASRKFLIKRVGRAVVNVPKFQCSSASRKFLTFDAGSVCALWACFSALQRAENSSSILTEVTIGNLLSFSALQRAENSSLTFDVQFVLHTVFQCSSASRKFLIDSPPFVLVRQAAVSVLFSEPKIPHRLTKCRSKSEPRVSVLFSEPKIPQCVVESEVNQVVLRFSALQRAENSSRISSTKLIVASSGFSALQRAENSSRRRVEYWVRLDIRVSVLFSEPKIPHLPRRRLPQLRVRVSVLFSEPKIPLLIPRTSRGYGHGVSVLFSEPKIPHSPRSPVARCSRRCFSALQRAENSSPDRPPRDRGTAGAVS